MAWSGLRAEPRRQFVSEKWQAWMAQTEKEVDTQWGGNPPCGSHIHTDTHVVCVGNFNEVYWDLTGSATPWVCCSSHKDAEGEGQWRDAAERPSDGGDKAGAAFVFTEQRTGCVTACVPGLSRNPIQKLKVQTWAFVCFSPFCLNTHGFTLAPCPPQHLNQNIWSSLSLCVCESSLSPRWRWRCRGFSTQALRAAYLEDGHALVTLHW